MSKPSVKITEPTQRKKSVETQHMSGEIIARTELAPFINQLIKKHKLSKIELASMLISIAYNLLRRDSEPAKANILFKRLANKTQKLVDFKKQNKVH